MLSRRRAPLCSPEFSHFHDLNTHYCKCFVLLVFDDISLEPGNIRIRKKGSAGGHNGIKNIIAMTGTQNFMRIKVGVGEKPKGWDLADYVLGHFSTEDRAKVEEAIGHAMDAAVLMMQGEVDKAMNDYNSKNK